MKIRIEDVNAVLIGFWLEPELLSLLVHPVDPVATEHNVKSTRTVDAPIGLQGSEAFQNGVHRYLSVEAQRMVTNSLAERFKLVSITYNIREIAAILAVTVARELIIT